MESCDVLILGGGIAGAFLARQLKLTRPSLGVIVLESAEAMTDYKVGESTVEVAANYMVRRLQLGTYLYQHQLPKNGLRFFFDSENKDLPLPRMSEIGSDRLPFHPSFQLERAALERDLVSLNRSIGVDVRLGAKAQGVSIANDGGRHRVTYVQAGETREIECRWVCDATGRRHFLSRAVGNKIHRDTRLNTAAAWGRYRNVAGLDAVLDPEWRQRVRYTSRHLSTNHMMYDGYWIWFIPLAGDLMSVGVVYDKDRIGEGPRNRAAFEAFLDGHRASRELMSGAVFEDFQAYQHLPYYADAYFSENRWALTGEAGAFTDPFYSPGSDFIATANELITSLIIADLDDDQSFRERVSLYDAFYKLKYETTIRLYAKLYPVFGTFDLFRLKFLLDFNNYYNLVVWPFMADKLTDLSFIRDELRLSDRILQAQDTMAARFGRLAEELRARGEYFAHNEGRFSNGMCGVSQLDKRIGPMLDPELRRDTVAAAYGSVFAALLERATGAMVSNRELLLSELNFPTVTVLGDADATALDRLLPRVAARIKKILMREFPDATIERVEIDPSDIDRVRVTGPADDVRGAEIRARADAMWRAEGHSLAHVRM